MITLHAYESVQDRNQYPDNDSKRLHLKGIDAAIEYLTQKGVK